MGNRAIITTAENYSNNGAGIYLHWNGGRDSVEAFLTYAKLQGAGGDPDYTIARLTQYIGNWFGGTSSLGIVPARCGAGDDNGVYIINNNLDIIDRKEIPEGFREQNEYDLNEMVQDINDAQPAGVRIKTRLLRQMMMELKYPMSYEEKIALVTIGTEIYLETHNGWKRFQVIGFGKEGDCFGSEGIPYVNYINGINNDGKYEKNPNNYLAKHHRFLFA